jgi:hypothetical protein
MTTKPLSSVVKLAPGGMEGISDAAGFVWRLRRRPFFVGPFFICDGEGKELRSETQEMPPWKEASEKFKKTVILGAH